MLKAIFYTRFHAEKGAIKLLEHPTDTIAPRNAVDIDIHAVSSYIIPPYELCNRALSVCVNNYYLTGWPISIEDEKYPRNRFTYNVCFVIDEERVDKTTVALRRRAWDRVTKKTAQWFREAEEDAEELSQIDEVGLLEGQADARQGALRLQNILTQVYEQLNRFGECAARLSDIHVLNLRLHVETRIPQACINAWNVPVLVVDMPDEKSCTWDIVLKRLYPFIDGVAHVQKIALLADVQLSLAIQCLTSLLRSNAIVTLDIFHFQAVYAHTADIAWLVQDEDMQTECAAYIVTSGIPMTIQSLANLYLSLGRGTTAAEVYMAHRETFSNNDVRRFITFGVIKGFLRRVHKYAYSSAPAEKYSQAAVNTRSSYEDAIAKFEDAWKQAALSPGWATPPSDIPASIKARATRSAEDVQQINDNRLRSYLNGQCCFDQICTELGMSEKRLLERLSGTSFGEVTVFSR